MISDAGITWIRDPIQDIVGMSGSVQAGCPYVLCKQYCNTYGPCGYECFELCKVYVMPPPK